MSEDDTNARSVLITGASSDIGAALARRLAGEGYSVTVTYRKSREAAEKLVAELTGTGTRAQAVAYDLTDPDSAPAVVAACAEAHGGLDAVVANALVWPDTGPGPMPEPFDRTADWQGHFLANAVGTMNLAHAAAPWLRKSDAGRLVFMGTSVLRHPVPGSSVYCAAKASLEGLTAGLVWDLGPDGVLVNVVMPGWVFDDSYMDPDGEDEMSAMVRDHQRKTPTGRLVRPADVASLVGYLVSPQNGGVNGEVVAVTGGY
jgi:NAD(P)-dependent dehydrogenase (short-subunit alcohol dehydrogenase family)